MKRLIMFAALVMAALAVAVPAPAVNTTPGQKVAVTSTLDACCRNWKPFLPDERHERCLLYGSGPAQLTESVWRTERAAKSRPLFAPSLSPCRETTIAERGRRSSRFRPRGAYPGLIDRAARKVKHLNLDGSECLAICGEPPWNSVAFCGRPALGSVSHRVGAPEVEGFRVAIVSAKVSREPDGGEPARCISVCADTRRQASRSSDSNTVSPGVP